MRRVNRPFIRLAAFILLCLVLISLCAFCYFENRLRPIVREAALSRARVLATDAVNLAVADAVRECGPAVEVARDSGGIVGVITNTGELTALRTSAVAALSAKLSDTDELSFSLPVGSLTGSTLLGGLGMPVRVRMSPIGDITADTRTEFIESGINQTLHRIVMRVNVTLNVICAGKDTRLELSCDAVLAETVIVGKVPDAYTAINRFEIDEEEENDLNDYAATLP